MFLSFCFFRRLVQVDHWSAVRENIASSLSTCVFEALKLLKNIGQCEAAGKLNVQNFSSASVGIHKFNGPKMLKTIHDFISECILLAVSGAFRKICFWNASYFGIQ